MGSIGKCCCQPCAPCVELADVTNWEIVTPLLSYNLSGTFGQLILPACQKFGEDCERTDNILHDNVTFLGDWVNPPTTLYSCEGPCLNCADLGEPIDSDCSIDLNGTITCPPSHPNYEVVEFQGRSGIRYAFWYSVKVSVTVTIMYISPTRVKIVAAVQYQSDSAATFSTRSQWRKRTTIKQCTSRITISTGAWSDPGDLILPLPIAPCVSLLDNVIDFAACPGFTPTDPGQCETITQETITYPCVEVVAGQCQTVNRSVVFISDTTRNCCELTCQPNAESLWQAFYEGEFDCDSIPEEVDLTATQAGDLYIQWNCDQLLFPDPDQVPDPFTITTPEVIRVRLT